MSTKKSSLSGFVIGVIVSLTFQPVLTAAEEWDPSREFVPVYRFFNGHHHFFTAFDEEANTLRATAPAWSSEGIFGYVCKNPEGFAGNWRAWRIECDRFNVALAENRFADAWNMGKNTEQGTLWKRLAFNHAKKHLKQLVREAVFEENLDKTIQAQAISGSFSQPIARELSDFIDAENASARTILDNLAPDTAARLAALRSIADRLFE